MQLFMYSPVSNLEDVFQNLLGITGYIEDLEVKSQSVKMLGNYSTETRDITVEKIWVDKNDDSKRPEEITVSLYADGVLPTLRTNFVEERKRFSWAAMCDKLLEVYQMCK